MKRFRINPVETALISAFALLFCHSMYRLFSGYDTIRLAMNSHPEKTLNRALASTHAPTDVSAPSAAATVAAPPAIVGPMPASVVSANGEITIDCDHEGSTVTVNSATIRIGGKFCRAPEHFDITDPAFHAEAIQLASGVRVPVKPVTTDGMPPHFSAEVPIDAGPNSLRIELVYPDGTQFARNLQIIRKD